MQDEVHGSPPNTPLRAVAHPCNENMELHAATRVHQNLRVGKTLWEKTITREESYHVITAWYMAICGLKYAVSVTENMQQSVAENIRHLCPEICSNLWLKIYGICVRKYAASVAENMQLSVAENIRHLCPEICSICG
jgi:hypothetical protein